MARFLSAPNIDATATPESRARFARRSPWPAAPASGIAPAHRPCTASLAAAVSATQAPAPAHLIEGAIPTEGAIAHGPVSKFADHLPLYRQSQILARSDIELHRSTLAGWVGKASFHLRPVYDRLTRELKTSDKPGLDETTVRVLDPGRGKTKTGYMWTMVRDERARRGADPPGCVYAYAQP